MKSAAARARFQAILARLDAEETEPVPAARVLPRSLRDWTRRHPGERRDGARPLPRGRQRKWTPDRCALFAADWNAGDSSAALQEKYGVQRPAAIARWLRNRGYVLTPR